MKKIAQKLRRIILLHFRVLTFWIHFGKTRKVIVFMFVGLGGREHDSKTYIIYPWGHQDTSNNLRKTQDHFRKQICWGILKISESHFWNLWKYVCRNFLKFRLINSRRFWIWDQYLSKNMKSKLGNVGSRSIKTHEMGIW